MLEKLNEEDAAKFRGWLEHLRNRVVHCRIDRKLMTEILDRLDRPFKNDQILSKISAEVHDEILKRELIRALMTLDGTFEVRKVAFNGRPLEWE